MFRRADSSRPPAFCRPMRMVLRFLFLLVAAPLLLAGCVTDEEFLQLSNRVNVNQQGLRGLTSEVTDLQAKTKAWNANLEGQLQQTRAVLPGIQLELDQMRQQLQRLTNKVEVSQQRGTTSDVEAKALKKELASIQLRLERLEATLTLPPLSASGQAQDRPAVPAAPEPTAQSQVSVSSKIPSPAEAETKTRPAEPAPTAAATPQAAYSVAETLFKKGLYDPAYQKFKEFVRIYPQSDLAPAAQFFAGECLYLQLKFEESILEYQEVVKKFKGNTRVSIALLKQALAFKAIGDDPTYRLLLKQIVKEYPDSYSGKEAKKKLTER